MGGASDSSSSQDSSFNQDVWGPSSEWYQFLSGVAPQIMGGAFGNMQQQIPGMQAGLEGAAAQANPAQQNQLAGGAAVPGQSQQALSGQSQGGFGYDQGLMSQYTQGLNAGPGAETMINEQIMGGQGNDYVDAMRGQMQFDANRSMSDMMNQVDARSSGNDMSGSSRGDIMQSEGARNINDSLQRAQTNLGYDSFDRNLDRNLSIAQRADANQAANMRGMEGLMSGQMGQQNRAQSGAIQPGMDMAQARNQAQQFGLGNVGNQQQGVMNTAQPSFLPGDLFGQWAGVPSSSNPLTLASGSGSGDSSSKGASAGSK